MGKAGMIKAASKVLCDVSDPPLRFDEAARRLSIETKTLRNWASAGRISFTRVGPRAVRIFTSEVERILTENYRPARQKDCA